MAVHFGSVVNLQTLTVSLPWKNFFHHEKACYIEISQVMPKNVPLNQA